MDDIYQKSLLLHEKFHGKLGVQLKMPLETRDDLNWAYTPGVAEPCRQIAKNPKDIYRYTMKSNTVAVITDGSAVLGLGNIGAAAGLPVMEGKCLLFKRFGNVDAFPICIQTQDVDGFVNVVKNITASFGGINLEDIAAPHCFEIEERLKRELDIPVFHDDQHGTAIVVLAALINALNLVGKNWSEVKVVISGAGAAGIAVTKMLLNYGVRNLILCDRHGSIYKGRPDFRPEVKKTTSYWGKRDETPPNFAKIEMAERTNPHYEKGTLVEMIRDADVFVGVSGPGLVTTEMVQTMASKAIIIAMANPTPEIMPDDARRGGAYIIATGRSDFPNQINNVLAFPGIFRGALDCGAKQITEPMKLSAAEALAALVKNPTREKIIPGVFDPGVVEAVSTAVKVHF